MNGTIDLSSTRVIEGFTPLDGRASVELLSADLSDDTTVLLELSVSGDNWDTAEESGTAISDTLVQGETKIISFEADQRIKFRVRFDGATTGNITWYTS